MLKRIILVHAQREQDVAERLLAPLQEAGYDAAHRGTVLCGESYLQQFSKYLRSGFPVVICGTVRAAGTEWAHKIVNAAAVNHIPIFPLKMEEEAYLDPMLIGDLKVIDCSGANFDHGIRQLIGSLQERYPPGHQDSPLRPGDVPEPATFTEQVTRETHYDEEVVSSYRERLRDEVREDYPRSDPNRTFLENAKFLVGGRLTLAGTLLFSKRSNRYSPMAVTKCSVYDGPEISDSNGPKPDFAGPVQDQIDRSYDFVLSNVERREKRRTDRPELEVTYRYPARCVREMIANALCHRDYRVQDRPVQVRVFSNRIEIGSPGAWYGRELEEDATYALEELECEPRSRNPSLARAIYNIKLYEGRGEGIRLSVQDCQEANADLPTVIQKDDMVYVTIYPRRDWELHKVSLAKLPSTSPDLFGREEELAMLDAAWENDSTNVVSLVAWGGVGKTALVNRWLLRMGADGYRGARRVYGYSFYSRGATEGRQESADPFIAAALGWFGDSDPTAGSPWDKGERLAELIRKHRTLLILDGLEPLQYPPGEMEGRLKDPGLQSLLRELARHNPGLCVVTTRLKVDDLKDFVGTSAERINLEDLSPDAGAELLKNLGVEGTPDELRQAVGEFGGHALALTLLGSLLEEAYDGDVRCRREIGPLEEEMGQGGHARRVMESYEKWLGEGPELTMLRLMGLFDRPAGSGALAVLRDAPVIPGLTDALFHQEEGFRSRDLLFSKTQEPLSDRDWDQAVTKLRHARLLLDKDPNQSGTLDAHPLVREHFGEKLKESSPAAWQEAHSRLYEYYKSQAKEYPDTIEEMIPLYAAVAHGCQAGRHHKALHEVYVDRIQRRMAFNTKKLGAFGAELAVLSGFFDLPWRRPVSGLLEADKSLVLNDAGCDLRGLGRLAEAVQCVQASLEAEIAREGWRSAAVVAGNLSQLYLSMGDLAQALDYAQESVDLAGRSGNWLRKMISRPTLASALHQIGRLQEAEAEFRRAEEMQKEDQPGRPFLYSFEGFQYCDLLLDQGKYREVQSRAAQTIEIAMRNNWLLDIALDHLSLGRAYLLQAQEEETGNFVQVAAQLDQAVDGLRQAGQQDDLPRGLLARAGLHRAMGDFGKAQRALDEAMTIATRGEMGLHQADCHLEYARLYLAMGEKDKARESLAAAREMIGRMGYHRRDGDVRELEEDIAR